MKKLNVLLFFCLFPLLLWGEVRGAVFVELEEGVEVGIPGVTVRAVDGSASTQTDADGYFQLDVPVSTQLYVECLGYRPQTITALEFNRVVLVEKGKKGGKKPKTVASGYDDLSGKGPWRVIFLVNGMSSLPFNPTIGLTIGMVRKGGWYLNGMTGFGFKNHDAVMKYGYIAADGRQDMPFYTGEVSQKQWSVTGGAVAKLGKSQLYWYIGAGYGFKSVMYRTNNGKWVAYVTDSKSDFSPLGSVVAETGFIGNIRGFAISFGYAAFVGVGHPDFGVSAAHELKIGIGGLIPTKR